MPLKEIHAPHLGRAIKMGRLHPGTAPRVQLARYLRRPHLPPAPPSCDFSAKAKSTLSQLYLNDELGDCVIAGGYHVVGVETGNAGNEYLATRDQIISDYSAIGGYNPQDPSTDQGCNEQAALHYWGLHGFANGTKLAGYAGVASSDEAEVKSAMFLFENLYLGLALPDAWVNPMPTGPGFTWDVAGSPDPENGHCVMACGYTDAGVTICTWGILGTLTWRALAEYAVRRSGGELYTLLTPDQLVKGQTRAPNGVDWTALQQDFAQLHPKH